jgi:hypothetical protein
MCKSEDEEHETRGKKQEENREKMEEEEGAHIKTTPFDLGSVYRKLRYFKRI